MIRSCGFKKIRGSPKNIEKIAGAAAGSGNCSRKTSLSKSYIIGCNAVTPSVYAGLRVSCARSCLLPYVQIAQKAFVLARGSAILTCACCIYKSSYSGSISASPGCASTMFRRCCSFSIRALSASLITSFTACTSLIGRSPNVSLIYSAAFTLPFLA